MSTATKPNPSTKRQVKEPPLKLKTRSEAREYLRKHLTPVSYGPKGQPIYAQKDLEALNVIFPEDL